MKWLSVAVLLTGSIACLPNVSLGLDRVRENVSEERKSYRCQMTRGHVNNDRIFILKVNYSFKYITQSALRPKRMTGGSLTAPVPWHAMVYLSENILDGGFAGGALIAERWILTAGRNLFVKKSRNDSRGKEPLIPKVYLGISKRSDARASAEVAVEKVFLHPGFQNTSDWDNDLALIKLKEPVNFSESIMPIPLPETGDNQEEKKGERGIIAGWGWGRLFTTAPILKFLALPIVPCQGKYQAKVLASTPTVTDKQFCTGPSNYQENVCFGDAGGALAFLNPNTNAVYAAGVLSFDKACSVEDHAVYIKISAYLPWIHSVMRGDSHEFAARRASFIKRMFSRHFALRAQFTIHYNTQYYDYNSDNSHDRHY